MSSGRSSRSKHRCRLTLETLESRIVFNAGMLDPSFNGTGMVVTDVGSQGEIFVEGAALQPAANGPKILVVDTEQPAGVFHQVAALYRYNPDGQLDSTFGQHGRVEVALGPTDAASLGKGVAVRPSDNSIYVAGYDDQVDSTTGVETQQVAVAHLNADGTLDTAFGQNGVVHPDLGFSANSTGTRLLLQSDGKLLVSGRLDFGAGPREINPYIARLNPDGSLDTGFFPAGNGAEQLGTDIHGMAEDSAGRILLAGESTFQGVMEFTVTILNPDGRPVLTLPNGTFGTGSDARAVAAMPSSGTTDDIFAVGFVGEDNPLRLTKSDFAFAKYHGSGQLDTGFANLGQGSVDFLEGNDKAEAAAVDASGDLLLAGEADFQASPQSPTQTRFALARITPSGRLDASFGSDGNGLVTTPFGLANASAKVMLVQPDGKIVLVGTSDQRIALARYLIAPPPPSDTDGDGVTDNVEDGVLTPSAHDGNDDGTPDRQEVFVASLPSAVTPSSYLTLESPTHLSLSHVQALAETPPSSVDLPVAAISFSVHTNLVAGTVTQLNLTFRDVQPGTVDSVYAFGPTFDDRQPHWYRLPRLDVNDAVDPGARIFPDHVIVNLADGDAITTSTGNTVTGPFGDNDLKVNGSITAIIAPAIDHGVTGTITGNVYHDVDANGFFAEPSVLDDNRVFPNGILFPQEGGLQGWTVTLDDGRSTITGADGSYRFDGLERRTYTVVVRPPAGQEDQWVGTVAVKSFLTDPGAMNPIELAAGDFNNDGRPDLAIATNDGNLFISLGLPDGSFATPTFVNGGVPGEPVGIAVGDFNGDGIADLALLDVNFQQGNTRTVDILIGNGDGTFHKADPLSYPAGPTANRLLAEDVNGDNMPDLVVPGPTGKDVLLYKGRGEGTFLAPVDIDVGEGINDLAIVPLDPSMGRAPKAIVVSGASDPMNSSTSNLVTILLTTDLAVQRTITSPTGHPLESLVTGSFHAGPNSHFDLAGLDATAKEIFVLTGDGNGAFALMPGDGIPAGVRPRRLAVGDLNGDGLPDLAVTDAGSNLVLVLAGRGNGMFTPQPSIKVGSGPLAIIAADLRLTGHSDLVVGNFDERSLSVLTMHEGSTQLAELGNNPFSGVFFGEYAAAAGEIHGTVRIDQAGTGQLQGTEPGVDGVEMFLDLNGNGQLDTSTLNGHPVPLEPSTLTGANGDYAFFNVFPGSYHVVQIVPAQWRQTFPHPPADPFQTAVVLDGAVLQGIDFGDQPPATVQGTLWNDLNGDGIHQMSEPGLGHWLVFADLNHNGQPDTGEPGASSHDDGSYSLPLIAGSYTITAIPPQAGWVQTFPAGQVYQVTVTQAQSVTGKDFAFWMPGGITGTVRIDTNGDGMPEDSEPGQDGATIQLVDPQGNVVATTMSRFAASLTGPGQHGFYQFVNVQAGTYTLNEIPPAGSTQIFPVNPPTVAIAAGQSVSGIDFANITRRIIRGTVRNDDQPTKPGLSGWTVYLDLNHNGQLDPGEPSQVTDADGNYSFDDVPPGNYSVAEVVQTGWQITAPGGLSFASLPAPLNVDLRNDAVLSGDFNKDGTDDLLVPDGQGNWKIAFGNGDGTFTIPVSTPIFSGSRALLADMDGNGRLDVVTLDQTGNGSVYLNHGNLAGLTAFGAGISFQVPAPVVAADMGTLSTAVLSADGLPDLIVSRKFAHNASPGGLALLFRHNPGVPGALLPPETITFQGVLQGPFAAAADFDGDGRTDLLGVTREIDNNNQVHDRLEIFRDNGNGALASEITLSLINVLDLGPIDPNTGSHFTQPDAPVSNLTVADFNGDGRMDVAFLSQGITDFGTGFLLVVLLNQAGPEIHFAVHVTPFAPLLPESGLDLATADLNGDGRADLVSGQQGMLAINNGDGSFSIQFPGFRGRPATIGHFSGSNRLDIIPGSSPFGSLSTFLNKGYVQQPFNVDLAQPRIAEFLDFLNRRLPDGDADGVDAFAEDGAPHQGDGNHDGIPDSQQANVASIQDQTGGQFVTVDASGNPSGTVLQTVHADPVPGDAPAGSFPVGQVSFQVSGIAAGSQVTVTLWLPQGVTANAYYKRQRQRDGSTAWVSYPNAVFLQPQRDPLTGDQLPERIQLHLTDGGPGDEDGAINGQIVDPGLPALVPASLSPEEHFVTAIYRDLLGRDPEPSGLAFWSSQLHSGVARAQLVQAIYDSAEHRGRQVDEFYAAYLHRAADPLGRSFWISQLQAGASDLQLAVAFLGSQEYQATHTDLASYLQGLYGDILGRSAAATELAGWQTAAANGLTRQQIVDAFLHSMEKDQQIVEGDYMTLLGRAGEPGGEAFWLAQLQSQRLTPAAVAEAFLASDEFFQRAQTAI